MRTLSLAGLSLAAILVSGCGGGGGSSSPWGNPTDAPSPPFASFSGEGWSGQVTDPSDPTYPYVGSATMGINIQNAGIQVFNGSLVAQTRQGYIAFPADKTVNHGDLDMLMQDVSHNIVSEWKGVLVATPGTGGTPNKIEGDLVTIDKAGKRGTVHVVFTHP